MPKADEGEVRVFLEMEVGTSPEVVNEMVKSTEDVIREVCGDDMNGWVTFAGASSWRASGGHKANYNIRLKPRTRRERSDQQIAEELDKRFKGWPGTVFRVRAGQGLFSRMMGAGSGEGVAVEIRGYDFDVAAALAAQVSRAMESVKGITDVKLSRDLGVPEDRLYIDRDKANDLGVPVRQVAEALRTILGRLRGRGVPGGRRRIHDSRQGQGRRSPDARPDPRPLDAQRQGGAHRAAEPHRLRPGHGPGQHRAGKIRSVC